MGKRRPSISSSSTKRGHVGLADALVTSLVARNVVVLGDPQQLPNVAQGTHPLGVDRSNLEQSARWRGDDRRPRHLPRHVVPHPSGDRGVLCVRRSGDARVIFAAR